MRKITLALGFIASLSFIGASGAAYAASCYCTRGAGGTTYCTCR